MSDGPGATAPSGAEVARALALRVLVRTALLWVGVVGVGFLLVDVVQIDERTISQGFVDARTATLNEVTALISGLADTQVVIATCVVVVGLTWWGTRQWWFAVVPAIALTAEATVFLTASLVVGRGRPEVDQLDHAPPTSSFPSGHTGAATSVYLTFALMATRIRNGVLRVTVIVVCSLVPLAVALARVYRGMHHPTDVLAGLVVGSACAAIAWTWLPRDSGESPREDAPALRASA